MALRSAPAYLASESDPAAGTARLTFLGLEDPAAVLQLYEDAQPGRLADQIMLIGGCPTVHDPSQAPTGQHVAFMWQKIPCALDGDPRTGTPASPRSCARSSASGAPTRPTSAAATCSTRLPIARLTPSGGSPAWLAVISFTAGTVPASAASTGPSPAGGPTALPNPTACTCAAQPRIRDGNITGLPGYLAAGEIAADLGLTAVAWAPQHLGAAAYRRCSRWLRR